MAKDASLLRTSIELRREYRGNHTCYYKLIIGTDPATRLVITDQNLKNLLKDLPVFLSTVIQSQVLIEQPANKGELIA